MEYLIKYSADIGTKSRGVKEKFQRRLERNIKDTLQNNLDPAHFNHCSSERSFSHIQLSTPVEVDGYLKLLTGIQYFTRVSETCFYNTDQVASEAGEYFAEKVKYHQYFAVRCKKSGPEKVSGREIERKAGERLIPFGKVNLDAPNITCFVEIRKDKAFFYDAKIPGPGGLPLGVQGKALTLFSGGIDSPVAAWMIYNSGLDQDFLFFDLGSKEQREMAVQSYKYLKKRCGGGGNSRFIEIDFTSAISELQKAPGPYQTLLLKYFFYKTAEKVAGIYKIPALATGEAIGQVSTQTLQNLVNLDRITPLLIIRPLSNLPKDLISRKAKDIGTFDLAYKGVEFCALSDKNVITGTHFKNLEREANKLNLYLIDDMVGSRKVYGLKSGNFAEEKENNEKNKKDVTGAAYGKKLSKPSLNDADQIIDLRSWSEFSELPIEGAKNIPFQHAWQEFHHWAHNQSYFLICETGSKSKILTYHMENEGFNVNHLPEGIQTMRQVDKTLIKDTKK